MIDRFLRAKHWQLFLLTFGIPLLFQFFMIASTVMDIASDTTPDPAFMIGYFQLFPILMILFIGVFFGWFWAVAVGLQRKAPANVKMKVTKFKIFFFIPMVYMLFITVVMSLSINGALNTDAEPTAGIIGSIMAVILPLHLFSMFCIFYSLYFVAKTFKTVELQREVTFSDFAGEFFLIWFYPVGVWIIQPKINKMVEA